MNTRGVFFELGPSLQKFLLCYLICLAFFGARVEATSQPPISLIGAATHQKLQRKLDDSLQRKLRQARDEFLPGEVYVKNGITPPTNRAPTITQTEKYEFCFIA